MKRYVIYSDNVDARAVGYVGGFSMIRSGGNVSLEFHWTRALLFITYAEACAVVAFIVTFVDERFDGCLSIRTIDLGGADRGI